jgi:aspartyl-tRNA(Asn)/glutamyl-tRNA(Gln) amidotransferase subunit B
MIVNWLNGPLLSEANSRNCRIADLNISVENLLSLVASAQQEEISYLCAKAVLTEIINSGKSAAEIIKEKNLAQVSDAAHLQQIAEEVIRENPKSLSDYKSGKTNALMFLVGQAMRKSKGKANPKVMQEVLKRRLDNA